MYRWIARLAALGVLAACGMNESGSIAATKLGDTTHPASRGSPIDDLVAACGEGASTSPTMHRLPYLQHVTSTSAMIGWVTTSPAGDRVVVTHPDGRAVKTVAAEPQHSPQRRPDAKQMWATIDGLDPATIYCYAIEGDTPLVERTGFRTAPSTHSTNPVRFLAFGDSGGGGSDQLDLRDQMYDLPYELIIHTGDLAYEDGTLAQFEDNVFGVYEDLFKNVPFFPVAGNHEYKTDGARPFRDVFALPGDGGERWYSFDWGRVHFAAIDTEHDFATQAAWLDRDLAASKAPWKIVYTHHPPYSSGNHGSDVKLRNQLAPVLAKHGVQLVLSGHDHSYERMIPQGGTAYVVTGGGGRGTYDVGQSSFTAFSEAVIHFVYVEIEIDELVLHAIDGTGVEFDSLVVPRR